MQILERLQKESSSSTPVVLETCENPKVTKTHSLPIRRLDDWPPYTREKYGHTSPLIRNHSTNVLGMIDQTQY